MVRGQAKKRSEAGGGKGSSWQDSVRNPDLRSASFLSSSEEKSPRARGRENERVRLKNRTPNLKRPLRTTILPFLVFLRRFLLNMAYKMFCNNVLQSLREGGFSACSLQPKAYSLQPKASFRCGYAAPGCFVRFVDHTGFASGSNLRNLRVLFYAAPKASFGLTGAKVESSIMPFLRTVWMEVIL